METFNGALGKDKIKTTGHIGQSAKSNKARTHNQIWSNHQALRSNPVFSES